MLLAIDTSGSFCSTALYDCDQAIILAQKSENLGRGHAERLMPMLEELLLETALDWQSVTRIAVVNGPGSFTGLRVGLATARGLALALNVPCTGVTQFEAFTESCANQLDAKDILGVIIDAKREQLWVQCFANARPLQPPATVSISDSLSKIGISANFLIGSGAHLLAPGLQTGVAIIDETSSPPIAAIARYAARQRADDRKPKTLYLRAPDAKPQSAAKNQVPAA